ncbi:MAG: hypothetical protein HW384_2016 [Dehalococcoidia bacterium]|nr:hypothetical protein [Dehalococcoidia bacterium]
MIFKNFVGVDIVAQILHVNRYTARSYLEAGIFPGAGQLPTGVWSIPVVEVNAMLRNGAVKVVIHGC